jgi:hypothetical protein
MPMRASLIVMQNEASGDHGILTWGAAQAGVAAGVADAVADSIIDSADVLAGRELPFNPFYAATQAAPGGPAAASSPPGTE